MVDVIEKEIEQIDIFIDEKIPLEWLSTEDRCYLKSFVEDGNIKKFEVVNEIIQENKVYTKSIYELWKNVLTSTDKFEDKYIRKKVTSLYNQFVAGINNIKIYQTDISLLDHMLYNQVVKLDEKFNAIISTDKFLEYYSFKDGIDTNKLKSEFSNFDLRMI